MTVKELIDCFSKTECPAAIVNEHLDVIASNELAQTEFAPIFGENELRGLLDSEELLEVNHKIKNRRNVRMRPKSGAFKGGTLEIIPVDNIDEGSALAFVTFAGRPVVKNSSEGEQYFMARFFEPKMREAVASIFSNVDMIRNSQATILTDRSEENLENITCEAYRILRWADHVRLITALEAGEMNITSSDIIEFSKNLIGSARIMLHGYDISEEYHFDAENRHAVCTFDREVLTRALLCLVSNACKAAGHGGIVKICITLTDSDYRFTISNGGAYIPAHLLPHVMEPYFSYKNSNEDKRGTGLGLTIAKSVAEHHGGSVLLQSSQEYGTTVMLRIPTVFDATAMPFVGQSSKEYLTNRYSSVFVELYGL